MISEIANSSSYLKNSLMAAWKDESARIVRGEFTADIFGFLTFELNAEVGALHSKVMPAILTKRRLGRVDAYALG